MLLTIYSSFKKRKNSTLRPTGGSDYNVVLKAGTSLESPVFLLEVENDNVTYNWSYAHFADSYYFVQDVVILRNHLVELHCTIDVLATYRADIGRYTAYVVRAASNYDPFIVDTAISRRSEISGIHTSASASLPNFSANGCYLVRTTSSSASSTKSSMGIMTYAMSRDTLQSVLNFMFDDTNYTEDALSDTLAKSFFNPFQYIVSVTWFPLTAGTFGSSTGSVRFGFWDTKVHANIVSVDTVIQQMTVSLPSIPEYDDFRSVVSGWTDYNLWLPAYGNLELNAQQIGGKSKAINATYYIDSATGEAMIYITDGRAHKIANVPARVGVPIAIGQLDTPLTGNFWGDALGTTITAIRGAINGLATGALNAVTDMMNPTQSVNGASGNMSIWANDISNKARITAFVHDSAESPLTMLGKPLYKNVTINTLSGYVQCAGASVPIAGTERDKTAVDAYLNGGFYYE